MKMEFWDLYDYLKSNIPTDPQMRTGYEKAIEDLLKRNEGVLCRGEGKVQPCLDNLTPRDFTIVLRYYYPETRPNIIESVLETPVRDFMVNPSVGSVQEKEYRKESIPILTELSDYIIDTEKYFEVDESEAKGWNDCIRFIEREWRKETKK